MLFTHEENKVGSRDRGVLLLYKMSTEEGLGCLVRTF